MGTVCRGAVAPSGKGTVVDVLFWIPVGLVLVIAVVGVFWAYYYGEVKNKQKR
jgi:membrane protein YdbS with pleckstrin-like domain